MICKNCNFDNSSSSKFCVKCGNVLETPNTQQPNWEETPEIIDIEMTTKIELPNNENNKFFNQPQDLYTENLNQDFIEQPQNFNQPNQETVEPQNFNQPNQETVEPQNFSQPNQETVQTQNSNYVSNSNENLNYLSFALDIIMKPVTTIKEKIHKFEDTKLSVMFAIIVSLFATIINLVKVILATVKVRQYDWLTGKADTTWVWENLKNIKWGEVVIKNFLIYAGVLVAIALVYYLASLIIKKQASFTRLLGIATTSILPIIILNLIVAPLSRMVYAPLGNIIAIVGFIYTILLLIDGVNRELSLEDNDTKIYTNLICLSTLVIIAYYLVMQSLISSLGSLGNIMDVFN